MERLKRRYTDQEVYNLLCILEAEKKCVQNLRHRLQQLESKEANLKKLQHLVDHYKQLSEERDSFDSIYQEDQTLQRTLEQKNEELEIALADLSANSDYIGTLQRELKEVKILKDRLQERVEELEESQEEVEVALIETEKREAEERENEERLQIELQKEREEVTKLRIRFAENEEKNLLALETLQNTTREQESLLKAGALRLEQLESSLRLEESARESEKAELVRQLEERKETLQALSEEVDKCQSELVLALEKMEAVKESSEQQAHAERATLQEELLKLRESVAGLRAKEEVQDQAVRTAQMHLARKIKEMADQKTLLEEKSHESREIRLKYDQMQMRLSDLSRELENKERETNRLQGEVQMGARALDNERREREEQFATLLSKMKEQEGELHRLKAIEARFSQLGSAFKGLNALMESPPVVEEKPLPPPPSLPPPSPPPLQDLFQATTPTRKFRESLFDE